MNGSRNFSDKRKTRRRRLTELILLALATALLVHPIAGQQPVAGRPSRLAESSDVMQRREPRGITCHTPYGPSVSRLPNESPSYAPKVPPLAVMPRTEQIPRLDWPDLPPGTPPGHGILQCRYNQQDAVRVVRLPPVLESLGRALVPASISNAGQAPAPQGHKISLSTVPQSGEVEVTSQNGLISLVARETPLNEILSSIAQGQRLNVVCAEDVTARISITLYEVTLEDALTAVLSTAGYTWFRTNDIIQVTSVSDAANLSPEVQGRCTEVFQLDYVSATDVDQVVKGLLSPAGQSFSVQTSPADLRKTRETIVVEDLPNYLGRIREYIVQVDQPPRQVLIEAHILEVALEDDNKHGVNFEHVFSLAGNSIGLSLTGMADPSAPQAFFTTVGGGNLESVIECLKTTTDAKTLASPKVLVVNGQEARIQIGEQLGFRVTTTTETSTMESVEFLDTGVVLIVTPHISGDNRVLMQVKPSVSSGAVNPDTGLPEEDTTEVETNVLVDDGQGILIGGLIQELDSNIQSKIPLLGDIWMVGRLFQRSHIVTERSEIIISLVARVVPYVPDYQPYDAVQTERTETPLTYGPLKRYPRPWEPSLPDTLRNPLSLRPSAFREHLGFPNQQNQGGDWESVGPSLGRPEVISPGEEVRESIAPHPNLSP